MIEFVILKKIFSNDEIKSRIHYCNSVFCLYFTYRIKDNALIISSFPNTAKKYLFIVGHNSDICKYILSKHEFIENLVIISCKIPEFYLNKFSANKIFISNRNSNGNFFYNGKDWGFNFNITEDELDLFNLTAKDIQEKINQIFRRVM